MSRKLLVICLFSLIWPLARAEEPSFLNKNYPQSLLRHETFKLPAGVAENQIRDFEYGNAKVGYFVVNKPVVGNHALTLDFFPPSYKEPIQFRVRLTGVKEFISLGTRKYNSPLVQAGLQPHVEVRGHFSRPYFLTTWNNPSVSEVVPVIFNNQGELVWAAPVQVAGRLLEFPMAQKGPDNKYVIVSTTKPATIVVYDGVTGANEREQVLDGVIFHHEFQYFPERDEILTLAYDCRPVSFWQDSAPLFRGPLGWFRWLTLPRRSYNASNLVRVNLVTGKEEILWSAYNEFSLSNNPNLALQKFADRFQDARTPDQYLAILKHPTYAGICDADWTHENSVHYYPGKGYLISHRNLNRMSLVGEDGKVKWTLGNGPENTYPVGYKYSPLGLPHDPQFIDDRHIAVFDNQAYFRGYPSKVDLPSKIKIYEIRDHSAALVWQRRVPGPQSNLRGNVNLSTPGFIFAHASGSLNQPTRFMEISLQDKSVGGFISLDTSTNHRSVVVSPIDSIGSEKYLSEKTPAHLGDYQFPDNDTSPPEAETSSEGY